MNKILMKKLNNLLLKKYQAEIISKQQFKDAIYGSNRADLDDDVYSPDPLEAYAVAQMTGNGMAPVLDPAHENGYFAHYHAYGRPKPSSHAFYGIPTAKGCY